MNKYYKIKIYILHANNITCDKTYKYSLDIKPCDFAYAIAKKVSFGFEEIKTGMFIKEDFEYINLNPRSYGNFISRTAIQYLREQRVLIVCTKIKPITDIKEIEEYLEDFEDSRINFFLKALINEKEKIDEENKQRKIAERKEKYETIKNNILIYKEAFINELERMKQQTKLNKKIKKTLKKYNK